MSIPSSRAGPSRGPRPGADRRERRSGVVRSCVSRRSRSVRCRTPSKSCCAARDFVSSVSSGSTTAMSDWLVDKCVAVEVKMRVSGSDPSCSKRWTSRACSHKGLSKAAAIRRAQTAARSNDSRALRAHQATGLPFPGAGRSGIDSEEDRMSVTEPLRPRDRPRRRAHVRGIPVRDRCRRVGVGMACGGPGGRGAGMADAVARGGQGAMLRCFRSVVPAPSCAQARAFTYGSRWLRAALRAVRLGGGAQSWHRRAGDRAVQRPPTVIPGCCGRSSPRSLPTPRRVARPRPGTAQTCWPTPHVTGRAIVCETCGEKSSAAGSRAACGAVSPGAVLCEECSFTAGSWAGEWQGVTTGECVVAAPCSVLTA